jgi:hypothetical protein
MPRLAVGQSVSCQPVGQSVSSSRSVVKSARQHSVHEILKAETLLCSASTKPSPVRGTGPQAQGCADHTSYCCPATCPNLASPQAQQATNHPNSPGRCLPQQCPAPQLSCRPWQPRRPWPPAGASPCRPAGRPWQPPPASAAPSCSLPSPPRPAHTAVLPLHRRTARLSRRCRAPALAQWGEAWAPGRGPAPVALGRGPAPVALQRARLLLGRQAAVGGSQCQGARAESCQGGRQCIPGLHPK